MTSEPTLDDLRQAMAAHTDGLTPRAGLARAARNRVARRRMTAGASAVVALLAAGSVVAARILPRDSTGGSITPAASTAAAPSTTSAPEASALNYRQVCQAEGSVCSSDPRGDSVPPGNAPAALLRPLRFPSLAAGETCPATTGSRVDTSFFGGIALGTGPVRPILAEEPDDARRGVADLLKPTSSPPWLGFETLWISDPSYQGPFIVRAQRLDGPGAIRQGAGPNVATLVVPPGPTINSDAGWRTAPGGTWVTMPGCYAWQIDGLNFSHVIIVNAVLAPPTTTSPRTS